MAEAKRKALNLDELFGQAKSVIVIHDGCEYEFMRVEALGPRQAVQLQQMRKKAQVLQTIGDELTKKQSQEIDDVLSQMITMLCPTFPVKDVTFIMKMRIVTFYIEETEGKKALENALKKAMPIGRKRSRR
jgi:hypothetical protein